MTEGGGGGRRGREEEGERGREEEEGKRGREELGKRVHKVSDGINLSFTLVWTNVPHTVVAIPNFKDHTLLNPPPPPPPPPPHFY